MKVILALTELLFYFFATFRRKFIKNSVCFIETYFFFRVVFTDWDPTEPSPDEYYIAMSCWHEYNWNAANDKPENTFISICEK